MTMKNFLLALFTVSLFMFGFGVSIADQIKEPDIVTINN